LINQEVDLVPICRSKPWIKWAALLLVVVAGVVGWTYRESLLRSVAGFLVDQRRSSLQQHVGQNLPKDFIVAPADGAASRAIDSAVGGPALLMLFSDKCPPCRSALNQIRLHRQDRSGAPWPAIFVLLRGDEVSPPAGVPADHVLYVEAPGVSDWLLPNVTPVFYRVDAEGRVAAILVGHDDQELAVQLDALLSPEASSLRIEN